MLALARTRAIHSLFGFAALRHPEHAGLHWPGLTRYLLAIIQWNSQLRQLDLKTGDPHHPLVRVRVEAREEHRHPEPVVLDRIVGPAGSEVPGEDTSWTETLRA